MNLQKLSLKELREMAKQKGMTGISGFRKAELITELEKRMGANAPAGTDAAVPKRKPRPEAKQERQENSQQTVKAETQ